MNTRHFSRRAFFTMIIAGILTPFAACADWAPEKFNSAAWNLDATTATYPDDLGPYLMIVTAADLQNGAYAYDKVSGNVGRLFYYNRASPGGFYTGTYDLTFTSATGGTFYDDYTGSFTGFVAGTFEVVSVDSTERPVAKNKTVTVRSNKKVFKLKGVGMDYPEKKLGYQITRQPKVGKLILKKGSKVIYKPKRGFTGNVKFKYIVKEGKIKSKPATVTLKVRGK